ncbi:phage antirepressor KilAC domain-containing protein [Fischerella sp. PCC 9605]|uniref:phage antirepressor KilAC domain-containing protein n=1 Tax=Fischerella sp. PCC 9605 TaxID=1173024 RepID=UPI0004B7379E|nr:phage antirepressor KilAC domain-containing protein [Fischerella sp. PCC 9605]
MGEHLVHIPEDIRHEFEVDVEGKGFASARATARLSGVTPSTLLDTREGSEGLLKRILIGKNLDDCLKPIAGFDYWVIGKIPDYVVACIITYYAKKGYKEAELVLASFAAIGIRTYIQKELHWQPSMQTWKLPQSYSEALRMLADEAEAHDETKAELAETKAELEEAQPKIALAENFIEKEELITFEIFAKDLNIGRNKFCRWLINKGYCYRKYKSIRAYSSHQRFFVTKPVTVVVEDKRVVLPGAYQTFMTTEGVEFFTYMLRNPEVREEIQATKVGSLTSDIPG